MDTTMILSIATVILAFFTAASAGAALWTAWETKKVRVDNVRPLLVPLGGKEGVSRFVELPMLDSENRWLRIQNIGLGPAENIAIRLQFQNQNNSFTIQLEEIFTAVEPLASGDEGVVYQWRETGKPYEIYDDHWIVISYDDIFHRHFETTARRIKDRDSWVSTRTKQVKKLPPRVRDVNYYANALESEQTKRR